MNIPEYEECGYCQQAETNVHALIFCKRSQHFWPDVKYWLQNKGYQNFRLKQKTIILMYSINIHNENKAYSCFVDIKSPVVFKYVGQGSRYLYTLHVYIDKILLP